MKSNVGILIRLAAMIYDFLLILSLLFMMGLVYQIFFDSKDLTNDINMFFYRLYLLSGILFYFIFSWVKGGQTVGMKAWKFKLITNDGNNVNFYKSLLRLFIAFISIALFGLGILYIFFNKDNLSLYDKLSNTLLVKVKNKS